MFVNPPEPGFGSNLTGSNWLGLRTLCWREVRRFAQVDNQTILAPVVTTLLFLIIFALTTMGFGGFTLEGTNGRLLAVVIMVIEVGPFLRLVQTIFRAHKVQ